MDKMSKRMSNMADYLEVSSKTIQRAMEKMKNGSAGWPNIWPTTWPISATIAKEDRLSGELSNQKQGGLSSKTGMLSGGK